VLLNHDTEVYVAPRPRGMKPKTPESQVIQPPSTSPIVKGKEKAIRSSSSSTSRGFKARLIPGRVAAAWGAPDPHSASGLEGRVAYCSSGTLRRTRRKFGTDGDVFVGVEPVRPKESGTEVNKEQEGSAQADAVEDSQKQQEKLECWLVAWDEVPDGHIVLGGQADNGWSEWQIVR